uniref:Fungal lipase-like domain-containing protein n=1 Tax=Pseudo-nitzschia australis TaxID=44445 RepID=A0A7S4EH39_9STRA|mmetsp:Transcript_7866/g.16876  ORF Transcript_7866/g.16876 Transcript_7866/m.16876 type:complete len:603 (-) Transcript_7866:503-2311(-)
MVAIIWTIRLGSSVLLLMPSCSLLTRNRNTNLEIHCGCVGFARAHDTDRYLGPNNRDDDDGDGDGSSFKEQHSKDIRIVNDSDNGGETSGGSGIKNDNNDQNKNNFFGEEDRLVATLENVWSVLKLLVPNRNTDGYIQPEANIVADFERIVLDMMTIGQWYEYDDRRGEEEQNINSNINSKINSKSNRKNKLGHGIGLFEFHSHLHSPPRSCDQIDLRSLKGKYRIGTFVDGDNGRSYCILATTSMNYPWGNVIVDLDPSSATKNLSFDCPHPKFDAETGEQGIRLLKGTTSRSWIVAGSHRMANNKSFGTCQPQFSYYPSDAAHSIDNCFLAAVAAIKFYYESIVHQDYTSVQLHGMGKTTCGSIDTFFSHGRCSDTVAYEPDITSASRGATKSSNRHIIGGGMTEKIEILQKIALAHPFDHGEHVIVSRGDNVDDIGDGSSSSSGGGCKLCGSINIQGRLINGVARKDLCDTFASSYNGRFVQIEQKRDYRRESRARFWNDVFNEAYPQFSHSAPATMAKTDGDCYGDYCDDGADDTTNNNDRTQDERNLPLSDFILFNLMLQFLLWKIFRFVPYRTFVLDRCDIRYRCTVLVFFNYSRK